METTHAGSPGIQYAPLYSQAPQEYPSPFKKGAILRNLAISKHTAYFFAGAPESNACWRHVEGFGVVAVVFPQRRKGCEVLKKIGRGFYFRWLTFSPLSPRAPRDPCSPGGPWRDRGGQHLNWPLTKGLCVSVCVSEGQYRGQVHSTFSNSSWTQNLLTTYLKWLWL